VLLVLVTRPAARADAVIVSKAAAAATICEFFIETNQLRVELEIGWEDLKAFRNLMPDSVYQKLGYPPRPVAERVREFLTKDWRIEADGEKLPGRIESISARQRVLRDEITGEPLGQSPKPSDFTVSVTLTYPFKKQPSSVQLPAPNMGGQIDERAAVGFVLYHLGVPVNDFRYLAPGQVVDLDWTDPWYSKFRSRNLWRAYNSALNVFLYVEPYEVRVEIIARPADLQQWIDLGLEGRDTIPVELQAELKSKSAEFLGNQIHLTVDGQPLQPALDRINFLRRTLRTSMVVDPPETLNIYSATLGAIYVAPTHGLPQDAKVTWNLFSPKLAEVSAAATDEAGPMPYKLTAADNVLHWQNFLKRPTIPQLLPVAAPPPGWMRPARTAGWVLCGIMTVGFLVVARGGLAGSRKRTQGLLLLATLVCLLGVSLALTRVASPGREQVGNLLRNIYHAFDFRDEGTVYDVLAQSVTGDLLTDVYLETRKGLELASQGGAKVKVKEVDVLQVTPRPLRGQAGFLAHCQWNVMGSVGHWGHIHQRTNQYEAELTIRPVDGHWKITGLELLQEERVN